jgi:alpha-beta hydrolase superfamily lysophospholipase
MSTFTFTSPENVEIFARKWASLSGPPKGAVQIAHGAAEHSQRYERFAKFLNVGGYVVYANDHQGHGQTALWSGKLGVAGADAWNNFIKDAKQLTDIIRKEYPNLPIFLFGHSMGSMIAQDYMTRRGADLKGVVLYGTTGSLPNLDALVSRQEQAAQAAPHEPSTIFSQRFTTYNTPFAPGKTGFEWLSRDESEVEKYVADPLCGFVFSNGLACDYLKGLRELWKTEKEARIPKDLPVLVISGDKDPVGGNTQAIIPLLKRYKSCGIKNLSHKFYLNARHELLNEINRDEVQQEVLAWLNKWCETRG